MNNEFEKKLCKKMLLNMSLTIFFIFSLYSLILTTLYVKSQTDIAFMIPVFVDLIPYITDICEVVGILVAYAFIIYAIKTFEKPQVNLFIVSFSVLTLYKYLAKFIRTYIINGTIPTVKTLFEDIVWSFILPISLELIQLLIIVVISFKIVKNALDFIRSQNSLKEKLPNYEFDESKVFFPFVKVWNMQNPFQKNAFWCGCVIMISKIIQLIIIDIQVGWPADLIDFIWIITSYSLCVLLGVASYLFVVWTLIRLNMSEIKLKYK